MDNSLSCLCINIAVIPVFLTNIILFKNFWLIRILIVYFTLKILAIISYNYLISKYHLANSLILKISLKNFSGIILTWLTAISAFSFWFIIGFPFEHAHESFQWITQYYSSGFFESMFQPIGHYLSYRPVGQLICALLFELSGGSLLLIQLFNFAALVFSLFLLIRATTNKKILSLFFLVIGGIFFQSFAYLFHLNGLFYSGIIIQLAVLIYYYYKPWSGKNLLYTFVISFLCALFNPFSVFIYIVYLAGLGIENKKLISSQQKFVVIILIFFQILLLFLLVPNQIQYVDFNNIYGLFKIYSDVESKIVIKFLILVFQSFIIIFTVTSNRLKILILVLSLVATSTFYLLKIPLITALIMVLSILLINQRKTTFLFLLNITFCFTLFTGLQPTHMKVYVFFILPAIMASLKKEKMIEKYFNEPLQITVILFLFLAGILLRNGVQIPKISAYSSELLAKKEKTYQLKEFISWYLKSEFKCSMVVFDEKNKNKTLLPIRSDELNSYLKFLGRCKNYKTEKLLISTNNNLSKQHNIVWKDFRKYSSEIYVYKLE